MSKHGIKGKFWFHTKMFRYPLTIKLEVVAYKKYLTAFKYPLQLPHDVCPFYTIPCLTFWSIFSYKTFMGYRKEPPTTCMSAELDRSKRKTRSWKLRKVSILTTTLNITSSLTCLFDFIHHNHEVFNGLYIVVVKSLFLTRSPAGYSTGDSIVGTFQVCSYLSFQFPVVIH